MLKLEVEPFWFIRDFKIHRPVPCKTDISQLYSKSFMNDDKKHLAKDEINKYKSISNLKQQ